MDFRLHALFEVVLVFILLTGEYRFFASFPAGSWIEYACVAVLFAILVSRFLAGKDFLRYGISPANTEGEMKAALVFAASMFFLMLGGFWVAFVLVFLAMMGRDFSRYGITMRGLAGDLKIVAICILPVMAVDCSAFFFSIGDMRGTLFFSLLIVVLLFILLWLLKNVPYQEDMITLNARYLVPVIVAGSIISLIFIPGITGGYHLYGPTDFVPLAINALVFGFVLQAIPQKILFRGYIQSRLNEAFGRPYTIFGISWGAGLVIASTLPSKLT